MNRHADFARLERDWGIVPLAMDYLPEEFRNNYSLAMDAQPSLITTGSAGIPAMFTSWVDPEPIRILQAPNEGAKILGEVKKGDWTTQLAFFPVVENTGQVAAYGDHSTQGMSRANAMFPQRQSFHFQTLIEYGDREVAMAGEAKLNWVSELQGSASSTIVKFADYVYHNGVTGLQNYGLLNEPGLPGTLTPVTKMAGGYTWVTSGGVQNATAAEIFADIQMLVNSLLIAAKGRIKSKDAMSLVMTPGSEGGLLVTNMYGISVHDLIKKNFPGMTIKTSPRYATDAGNVVQLFAEKFDGKDTGYCAFTEKGRDFPIVRKHSAYEQKKMAGAWGFILRYPICAQQMLGV
jgi:hypothetical protein